MHPNSSDGHAVASTAIRAQGTWREIELMLLVLLVLGAYFFRLTDLTIRGEESRWARVAQEMIETGDWIVPRQQGAVFPDRPPLNSWAMILASKVTGHLNLVAIRLPAVLATLATTLLIYVYGRNFLSRVGGFMAAAAYPTMAQILQLGRLAESDALLILSLSAALFTWHYAYVCRQAPAAAWIAGYALAALAGLAKGPQGPAYFVAITTVYLMWQRDWRTLFSPWHAAGLAAFVAIVGAWQIPFYLELGGVSTRAIWSEGGEVGGRFAYRGLGRALARWGAYPFEVWACMLPWSFLLPPLATRWFRQNVGEARPMFGFLITALCVTLPTCWLPADSRPRYFMSLYPCVALLVGLCVERSWQSRQSGWWPRSWDNCLRTGIGLVVAAPALVVAGRFVGSANTRALAQSVSPSALLLLAAAAPVAAGAMLWSRRGHNISHGRIGILAMAGFIALAYNGIVVSMQVRLSNNPGVTVAQVRDSIPPEEHLVSFGKVHHLFAYYYQQPIELQRLENWQVPEGTTANYFCYNVEPNYPLPHIPFDWELIAEVSCERARSGSPRTKTIIGRRVNRVARADRHDKSPDGPDTAPGTGRIAGSGSARNPTIRK